MLLETLRYIWDDYACELPQASIFTVTANDGHSTESGASRKVCVQIEASEIDQNNDGALSEIKALTGGDKITARFMAKDLRSRTRPQFKLLTPGIIGRNITGVN